MLKFAIFIRNLKRKNMAAHKQTYEQKCYGGVSKAEYLGSRSVQIRTQLS